ncbi:MAG TPA: hypothetical protein VMM35_08230, partial [Longimicrobiales bacterium]|nr:hypothetical protein [Longimicrobiales bacterium]
EGHRAQDLLLVAVSDYILGDRAGVRGALERVRPGRLLRTRRVQRWRLLILWAILHLLSRLPRLEVAARAFSWRWHRAGEAA